MRIRLGTPGREVGGGDGPDHGTFGNLRNSLESGIPPPPSQAFRGTRAERTSAENSTMGKSAELESGARPMAPVLLLQRPQGESSRAWKGKVWRKRREETERRSIGPCQRSRGLEGSHPVSTSRDSGSRYVLGTKSTPSRGLSRLSRERIPTLWVWYERRNDGNGIEVNRDRFKE